MCWMRCYGNDNKSDEGCDEWCDCLQYWLTDYNLAIRQFCIERQLNEQQFEIINRNYKHYKQRSVTVGLQKA